MAKQKNWRDKIIPCDCPRWETCKYGETMDWQHKRYAVCGYSFITKDVRGCPVSECDKYAPKKAS